MSKVVLTKDQQGKLAGLEPVGQRAYARFKRMVTELQPGQTLSFSYWLPRCPEHHAFFFLKLNRLLSCVDGFDDVNKLRHWLTIGAGHCDFVPGPDGTPNAIPKSLDFESMDEADFCGLQLAIDQFLWTAHAQAVLWPELSAQRRWECMESFMGGFRR